MNNIIQISQIVYSKTLSFSYETKKRRYAMLDILLAAESDGLIDHEGIREEVDTFMFEGHDTTSAAIIFTFLLLAHNFDIQDQVVEEAKQVLGNMEDISTKEFGNLKFLDRVIKEYSDQSY